MKKNIIKIFALLLVVCTASITLTGCLSESRTETPKFPAELTIKGDSEGITAFNASAAALDSMMAPKAPITSQPSAAAQIIELSDYSPAKDGVNDDSSALSSAITAAAAIGGYVFIDSGSYCISSNITVPENVTLYFSGSAKLVLGGTLTVNSTQILAGAETIFTGNGTVAYMPNISGVYPEWWGAVSNDDADDSPAIQKAINAADKVFLREGIYGMYSSVTIPQNRSITVSGTGRKSTDIYVALNISAFSYVKEEGYAPSTFTVSYLSAAELGHNLTSTFVMSNGGIVYSEASVIRGFGNGFLLLNTDGSTFKNVYGNENAKMFYFSEGNHNTRLIRCMGLTNYTYLTAANGTNLDLMNSSSVWNYGYDVDVTNYNGFIIKDGGTDLGYTDSGKGRGENPYAIKLTNVSNFEILGMWVASNNGLSCSASGNTQIAEIRTGVYLDNCTNGTILGCTITNHKYGMQLINSTSAGNIEVIGNTFIGNVTNDVVMTNPKNVEFSMNFHNQWPSDFNITEVTATGCDNVVFSGNSYRRFTSDASLKAACGTTGVITDSNLFGVGE